MPWQVSSGSAKLAWKLLGKNALSGTTRFPASALVGPKITDGEYVT